MSEEKLNFLKKNNIDVENAINYTGDYETYNEVFIDLYNEIDEQLMNIEQFIDDMPNYAILVHALKSNARTLGINFLQETAYNHEIQSKANNIEFVHDNYNELKLQVEKFKSLASEFIKLN